MGARTLAREAALQMLFAWEASAEPIERVLRTFWAEMPGDAEDRAYADELARGVAAEVVVLDERVRQASRNWRLERMTRVDRALLRIGAYELSRCLSVPRAVVIDEAVELAKRFGTAESGAFVNGVLDRIADDCGRIDEDRQGGGEARAPSSRGSGARGN